VDGRGRRLAVLRQPPPAGDLSDIETDLERAPELIEEDIDVPELSPQPAMA
jgi:hypothetical protein